MSEKYRVTGPNYGAPGNRRERGEVFEPTDAELRAFGDKLTLVEASGEDASAEDSDGQDEEPDADEAFQPEAFLDRTLDEGVVDDIKDGAVDEHLDQIEEHAERDGVHEAIEARRDELEE